MLYFRYSLRKVVLQSSKFKNTILQERHTPPSLNFDWHFLFLYNYNSGPPEDNDVRFQWGTKAKPCRLLIRIRVMRGYRDILGQKIPRVITQKIRLITRSVQAGNKVVAYAIVAIFPRCHKDSWIQTPHPLLAFSTREHHCKLFAWPSAVTLDRRRAS